MGGGSETVRNAQIVGLSKEFGKLKKKIFLESGKHITTGMKSVIKVYGQNIVDIKSLYNKSYLKAMGYDPYSGIKVNKVDENKILEYTKNNIDSRATYISDPRLGNLTYLDQVMIALQDKPNFKRSEMSFTHTDGRKYYAHTAIQNGSYLDIPCYLNNKDTVTSYLGGQYPHGYRLLDMGVYPSGSNGSMSWTTTVEYIYYEEKIVEEVVIVDGVATVVQKVIKIEKKAIASDSIPCVFIYITIEDAEETHMYDLAQRYSGPFTTTGSYTEENDEVGDTTYTTTVTGTFTVTYIGNGEFNYDINAPYPSDFNGWSQHGLRVAWDIGVTNYQAAKMAEIDQIISGSARRLIWDYGIASGDYDNLKRAYITGDLLDNVIVIEEADIYPIIPLKRNLKLVNNDKMDIVLKKIGIEGKDFHDSIRQNEIWDTYLFFGIPFSSSNPGLIEYIFEFFTTLTNVRENFDDYNNTYSNNTVNTSFDGMGMLQNYKVESWIVEEPATRPVGTYWYQTTTETVITGYETITIYNEDGWDSEITKPIYGVVTYGVFCYQESEAYYIKIRPIATNYWYILGGTKFGSAKKMSIRDLTRDWAVEANFIFDEIELRIPILKQITNKMKFNLLCDVIEQSMAMAVYTQVEVKTKWYQSGFFKFVVAAIAMSTGQYWVVGVMMAAEVIIAAFGAVIGGIFQIIVTVVLLITQNYATAFQMTVKNVMLTASQVLSLVSGANNLLFSIKYESKAKEYSSTLATQEAEKKKLEEEYDKLYENEGMIVNMFNNFKSLDDIDTYYSLATGDFDSYHLMLDYATDYDKFYVTK